MALRPRLTLTHFGHQCPWLEPTAIGLRALCAGRGWAFEAVDTGSDEADPDPSAPFPFTTEWQGRPLTDSPVFLTDGDALVAFADDQRVAAPTPAWPAGEVDTLRPLTVDTLADSVAVCRQGPDPASPKIAWMRGQLGRIAGYVGYRQGQPVALVEYLVRSRRILCLHTQEAGVDYRGPVLDHFEAELRRQGPAPIGVWVGRHLPYPNGPRDFFIARGYVDHGERAKARLIDGGVDPVHWMTKDLG